MTWRVLSGVYTVHNLAMAAAVKMEKRGRRIGRRGRGRCKNVQNAMKQGLLLDFFFLSGMLAKYKKRSAVRAIFPIFKLSGLRVDAT